MISSFPRPPGYRDRSYVSVHDGKDASMSTFRRCAIIGAGLMGPQIAVALAAGAKRVRLHDTAPAALERAPPSVPLDVAELAKHDFLEPSAAEKITAVIEVAAELGGAVSAADFMVEAMYEDVGGKGEIFGELDAASDPSTVVASNTSSIPIRNMAEVCRWPERIVGTHFALPAHILPFVEVIRHPRFSNDCFDRTFQALVHIKKVPTRVSSDVPGFAATRREHFLARQAIVLVARGIAGAEDVDTTVRHGFGLRLTSTEPPAIRDISRLLDYDRVAGILYPGFDATGGLAVQTPPEYPARCNDGVRTGCGLFGWGENEEAIRTHHSQFVIEQARRVAAEGPMKREVRA